MKLPRDITGIELAKALSKLGYATIRQKGSHLRLTTSQNGTHHVTIPKHNPIKIGTLAQILDEVALHFGLSREQLLNQIFE